MKLGFHEVVPNALSQRRWLQQRMLMSVSLVLLTLMPDVPVILGEYFELDEKCGVNKVEGSQKRFHTCLPNVSGSTGRSARGSEATTSR